MQQIRLIRFNKWDSPAVKDYKHVKDELSVSSHGLILRGNRIVVPHSLRLRSVDIAHESHLGIQKTKALLREKVWFPQIDNIVKNTIEKCVTCQAVASPNPPEPLAMTQMPKSQWEVLNIDFYGPLPIGEYLLVVIDRYSRFPEVEIVSSTKAPVIIPRLDKIFAVHGIPAILR